MRRLYILNTFNYNYGSGNDQKTYDRKSDQRLNFSVAVGMIFIGRTSRVLEPEQYQQAGKDIGSRFYCVGDECIRISKNTRYSLYNSQSGISENAEIRGINC